MICQHCGMKPATIHFTKIVNGEKSESRVCELCAREQGEVFPGMQPTFSIQNLLSGMMAQVQQPVEQRCESCGLSYSQFSKLGRFGCSDCYRHFATRLEPLFRRVHGHTSHIGKIPNRAAGQLKVRRELADLKKQMQVHIERQEFEQAANVRDRIKELGDV